MSGGYDYTIVGSGIYGMYASRLLAEKGNRVLIIECDGEPFTRASYVNQARVHNGYHYPRSYSTAIKSAKYYERFCRDFDFAINKRFTKIYAISSKYSLTSGAQFEKFCKHAGIPCDRVDPDKYFNPTVIEAAFETLEYAFDAGKIRDSLNDTLNNYSSVERVFNTRVVQAERSENYFDLKLSDGRSIKTSNVINCSYASINQVNALFGYDMFRIKYEIAEIILCDVSSNLKNLGITVMDGPFFSVMPFGDTGLHTLTAVTFTPHKTCYNNLPSFNCQTNNGSCTETILQNCNTCLERPETAMPYMSQLAKKYLTPENKINYRGSLFAIKPILLASEIDDSRPTVIRNFSKKPGFTAILSGKINTIYDMENVEL